MTVDLAILTATGFEQDRLQNAIAAPQRTKVAQRSWTRGALGTQAVLLVETGMGAVNCAHALTCLLQTHAPRAVWQIGVGGAYERSGLVPGDLAVATREYYGDIGVRLDDGWQDAQDTIGIPLLRSNAADGQSYFNCFDLDVGRARDIVQRLNGAWRAQAGPFVTVQECTGSDDLGRERGERFDALCENMEGAAAAHLCALYDVDFVEVRAISNIAARRDRDAWELPLACLRAQEAALLLLNGDCS
jgi:futalosine hydrolase